MSIKSSSERSYRTRPVPRGRGGEAALARPGEVTFDEFCVVITPEQKADLIDGVIHMASPENLGANEFFLWLAELFQGFVRKPGLGKVYGSRVAFRMGAKHGPEPDIAFVRADRLQLARETFFDGPPDLAVEIVSPESVHRDYVTKRDLYEAGGVAEYWIIDQALRKVTVLRPGKDRKYREVRPVKQVLRSQVLPGFWLRTDWLWNSPRRDPAELLAEILQAP